MKMITLIECFHSFEVGFGPYEEWKAARMKGSFHSFEVGFGLVKCVLASNAIQSFHSFEVGFGLLTAKLLYTSPMAVFIPSR